LGDLVKHTIIGKNVIEKKAIDSRVEITNIKNKNFGQKVKEEMDFGMNSLKFLWQRMFFG
jgi:hypothetical protein